MTPDQARPHAPGPQPRRHHRRTARAPRAVVGAVLAALTLLFLTTGAPAAQADGAGSTPPGKAWVRAGHLVPGIGAVRVELVPQDGVGTAIPMAPGTGYGQVTDYQKVDPGTYTVTVRPEGDGGSSTPMLSRSLTVTAGNATTIAVLGSTTEPRLGVLSDDLTPPAAGSARVRVLSGSTVAPTVSVTAVNGPMIATGAVLGQATPYSTVPAGSWTLQLSDGAGMTVTQTISLTSGSVYTAVVVNSGTSSVELKVITDAAGAMATPVGGAQTGGGGTAGDQAVAVAAPHDAATPGPGLGLLAASMSVLVGAAALRARRTPRTARLDR